MRFLRSILVALVIPLLFATMVHAGDYEDAAAAYNRGDYSTALRLLRPLAEQGGVGGQTLLGVMYARGEGVPQDYAEAVKWWRSAAEQGFAMAQFNLGFMYAKGDGVPEDDTEAAKWYRKAAEQGEAKAQYNLGLMYSSGKGVPEDRVQAYIWINIAAAQGYQGIILSASSLRDIVAKHMTPEQIAEAQRMSREWWAAHQK